MGSATNRQKKIFDSSDISAIADKILKGSVAILPTSTIYGISCVYNNEALIKRVYEIKQRPGDMPFILLIPDISWLELLAEEVNGVSMALIKRYWLSNNPEPLTLVLKKRNPGNKNRNINPPATYNLINTIAVRLDTLPPLADILKICGPVISTSATLSGTGVSPKRVAEVPQIIRDNVDFIFDYKKNLPGIFSTILDVTQPKPVLLREGRLKYDDILKYLSRSGP